MTKSTPLFNMLGSSLQIQNYLNKMMKYTRDVNINSQQLSV